MKSGGFRVDNKVPRTSSGGGFVDGKFRRNVNLSSSLSPFARDTYIPPQKPILLAQVADPALPIPVPIEEETWDMLDQDTFMAKSVPSGISTTPPTTSSFETAKG